LRITRTGWWCVGVGLFASVLALSTANAEADTSQVVDLSSPFSGADVDLDRAFTVEVRTDAESAAAIFVRMHWGPWGMGMKEEQTACEALRRTLDGHFIFQELQAYQHTQVPLRDLVDEAPVELGPSPVPSDRVTCTLCKEPAYKQFKDKPVYVSAQALATQDTPGVISIPVHAPEFFRPGADYCLILVEQNVRQEVDLAVRKELEKTFVGYAECERQEQVRRSSGQGSRDVTSPAACRKVHLDRLFESVRVVGADADEVARVESLIFDDLFRPSLMTSRDAVSELAATWQDKMPSRRDMLWDTWKATGDFHRRPPACPLCELTAMALVGNGILERQCDETPRRALCRYVGPGGRSVAEVVPIFDPLEGGVQGFDILLAEDGNPRTPDSVRVQASAEELQLPGTSISLADVYERHATDFVTLAEGFLDGTLAAAIVPNSFDRFMARLPLASPRDPVVRLLRALDLDNRSLALGELAMELLAVRGYVERAGRRNYRAIDSQRRVVGVGVVIPGVSNPGGMVLWLEPDGNPTTSDRSELDISPGALTLPGSEVSLEDLLHLVTGRIHVPEIADEWFLLEDLMDEETPLGRPFYPVWKADAPRDVRTAREAIIVHWDELMGALVRASRATHRAGLNDLDGYKLVGRWLRPVLEGPGGDSRGSGLEHGLRLLENMQSYHRMALPWDTHFEDLGVRLTVVDVTSRAGVLDAQAALTQETFLDQFVKLSLGYQQVNFPDGTADGTVAVQFNIYAYPNAIDEPMWSNGIKADLRRLLSLQVGLLGTGGLVQDAADSSGAFGPAGRYTGVITGLPPISVGIGAQILPYVTLSAGGVWMAERTTTLEGERARPVFLLARGVFLEINAFSYFRKLYQGEG